MTTDEFTTSHVQGWSHGVERPYAFFIHELQKALPLRIPTSTEFDQDVLLPKVVMSPVDYEHEKNQIKFSMLVPKGRLVNDIELPADLQMESNVDAFSAFYLVPPLSFNYNRLSGSSMRDLRPPMPKLFLQNHFEIGDFSYAFGGLYTDELVLLSRMGIPTEVDLDMISVHLPVDLPPFIDRKLISNPFIVSNDHLVKFSRVLLTFSFVDYISKDNFPGHISGMSLVAISEQHVFFMGGFILRTDKVQFDRDSGRWLVYKLIEPNESGYILDTMNRMFTKVKFDMKQEAPDMARLGIAIFTKPYISNNGLDMPVRVPLPIFTDSTKLPVLPPSQPVDPSPSKGVLSPRFPSRPLLTVPLLSQLAPLPSGLTSGVPPQIPKRKPRTKSSLSVEPILDLSTVDSRDDLTAKISKESSFTEESESPSMAKVVPNFRQNLSSLILLELLTSKVSSMLSKLTRIFHRHHSSQSKLLLSKEVTMSEPRQPRRTLEAARQKFVAKRTRSNSHTSLDREKLRTSTGSSTLVVIDESPPVTPLTPEVLPRKFTPPGITPPIRASTPAPTITLTATSATTSQAATTDSLTLRHHTPVMAEPSTQQRTIDLVMNSQRVLMPVPKTEDKLLLLNLQIYTLTMYVFGGFIPEEDDNGYIRYQASNQMIRIDLPCEGNSRVKFDNEALVCVVKPEEGEFWPSARGYYGGSLVDEVTETALCQFEVNPGIKMTAPEEMVLSRVHRRDFQHVLDRKKIMIHGGVNEDWQSFSDLLMYDLDTNRWQVIQTYAFDYYCQPKSPDADESLANFIRGEEVVEPPLVEAELRACHHLMMYLRTEESDLMFFFGGFNNHSLRHYDSTPYISDKFDVLRLCKFPLTVTNSNMLRVPVLDLRSQTWRFMRYYFEVGDTITNTFLDKMASSPTFTGAHICNFGGHISMHKRQLTIYHGIFMLVPVKKDDLDELRKEVAELQMLWGAVSRFSFPSV